MWVVLACKTGYAQTSPGGASGSRNASTEKTIRAYYTAYEKKDWDSMQQLLADGFTFTSPVDDSDNVKVYKERCWPTCYKIKRFDVVNLVVNGDDAFVIYNGWTMDGKLFHNTEHFHFKDGKILSDECFFGRGVSYPK